MPQVLDIEYRCLNCGQVTDEPKSMLCKCGGELKGNGFPSITGTRDSFGIGKEFKGPNGKTIDTWRKWERAGYKDPLSSGVAHNKHTIRPRELQTMIKRKVDKITKFDTKNKARLRRGQG